MFGLFRLFKPQMEAEIQGDNINNVAIDSEDDNLATNGWSELSCPESDRDGFEVLANRNIKPIDLKDILQREPLVSGADDVTIADNLNDIKYDDVTNSDYVMNNSDDVTYKVVSHDFNTMEEQDGIAQELLKGKVLQKLSECNQKNLRDNSMTMIVWRKTARKGLQLSLTKLLLLAFQLLVVVSSITFACAHDVSDHDMTADIPLRSCDQDLLQSHDVLRSCDEVHDLPILNTGKYSHINEIGVPELSRQSVHIKDPKYVASVITDLIQAGDNKLQVVADFDFTLSCFTKNGENCVSCHKALDDSPLLPDDYRNQAHALRDHYYPLEIDPYLTKEEKFPLMEEWWNKSHQLLIDYKLSRHDIEEIVRDSKLFLRQGCTDTFEVLHKHSIPLMIFSAGLGDIINAAISQQTKMYDNMKIVGNMMAFDNKGIITGFQGKNIHSLNKNESALSHADGYFQKLSHRDRLILLGDNLGDLHMADGAEHIKTKLTIGFLNDKIEERLESYKNAYDIVIVNEETVDVPNAIFQAIFK